MKSKLIAIKARFCAWFWGALVVTCMWIIASCSAKDKLFFILISSLALGFFLFRMFYCFSFRFLPNLALSGAWTVLFTVFISAKWHNAVTFIGFLKDAYERSNLGSNFIKTFMEIYSIGIFGTVFISLVSEASKNIWSDELYSNENKTLMTQFKRIRRHLLLSRHIKGIVFNIIYIHMLCYMIALLITFAFAMTYRAADRTILRIDLILLLFSVTLEAMGLTTHLIITDDALVVAECKYLKQRLPRIQKKLEKMPQDCAKLTPDTEVNSYLRVLVHTYCNHNGVESVNRNEFFPHFSQGKPCNIFLTIKLIELFDKTYKLYIEPNEEKYYMSARKAFEPAFAQDIKKYLFEAYEHDSSSYILLSMIELSYRCFFENQKKEWEKWLYISGEPIDRFESLLMLDFLRWNFSEEQTYAGQCFSTLCSKESNEKSKEERNVILNTMVLEFPYIMETLMQNRYGKKFSALHGEKNPPHFQERVEEYYWNVFLEHVNNSSEMECNEVAERFSAFLKDSYEGEERFLHRILPINRAHYSATSDKPDFSIKLSETSMVNIVLDQKSNYLKDEVVPGWGKLFSCLRANQTRDIIQKSRNRSEHLANLVENKLKCDIKRLCRFDQREDTTTFARCDRCCVDENEMCHVLASVIFERREQT